ncbi:thermonuclease family protein [Tumebacillus lipolyticus]|uniref:Thermonuclease family protein n=1 Tax=Tumebacillus lipolyticus TaxID=1280370 RepID=A0ABW4ZR95_9BACL
MKKIALLFICCLGLLGCAEPGSDKNSSSPSSANSATSAIEGRYAVVTHVADGDTIQLENGEKVRMIGVNTPETKKPGTAVQPYGQEASDFTKKALEGKKVFVETDVQPTDRYGRTLAYIYTEAPKTEADIEALMFNATLLREGYAQLMTIQPNVKYQELFLKLQRKARADNLGLWALGIYKDSAKSTNDVFEKEVPEGAKSDPAEKEAVQPTGCADPNIKGNINTKGEKIYHVPGGRYYEQTKAEQLFCSPAEAEAAGFRKSKQ